MKKIRVLSLLAVAGLAAYAGSANSSPDSASTSAPTSFSAATFQQAAQATLGMFKTLSWLPGNSQAADTSPLLRFGKDQLPKLKGWLAFEPALAAGAMTTDAIPCSGGGSITYTYTAPSDGDSGSGDRYTLSAHQCVEQLGTINGVLVATVQQWSESASGYRYLASLDYQNLSITSASGSISGNGPLTLDYAKSFATGHAATAMSTPSFAVTTVHGTTTYNRTLRNYSTRYHETLANSTPWMEGTVASSPLGSRSVTVAADGRVETPWDSLI